jgi:AcrR family transcriptional regulator
MKKVKRKYESAHRKLLAGKTREQILESARRLFRDHGYGRTTIEQIAAEAGVAVPTVYATYGGKRAILLQFLEEMESAADVSSLRAALQDAGLNEHAQLRAFIDFTVRLFTEDRDLIRIAELAGVGDPDVASVWQTGEARGLEACRTVVAGWARRRVLRRGLTESRAVDILWSLTSAEFYGLFIRKRQWTGDEYGAWLYRLAAEQLLANPAPAA